MNIEMIEKMILAGTDSKDIPMQYAKGFGRSLAIIWQMVQRMSQQEKDEFLTRLINHSEVWEKQAKKVEESTT
jgi:hypothetical protein